MGGDGPRNTVISGRNSGEGLTPLSLMGGGGKGDETPRGYIISSGMGKWSGCGRVTILAGRRERRVGRLIN